MKIFIESWKKHKYIIPPKWEWYYLYYRLFIITPSRWWRDRKDDFRAIKKNGFRKAKCKKCWFSCKGHTYRTKYGLTYEQYGD